MKTAACYGEDLAYIHDAGFGGFALNSAPGLLQILRRNGIHEGLVVDLGCGSGIWLRQLGFAGYDALGVDVSSAMIRLARKKAPRATLVTGSLADVELPRCAAVTSIGECVSYTFAADSAGKDLFRFFRRVHRALLRGGVFVFDFAKAGREPGGMPQKSYWSGDGWTVLVEKRVEASEDRAGRVLTRRITSFRRIGKLYRRTEETHHLRLYQTGELEALLRRAGFEVERLSGFGRVRFRSGHGGMLARKTG
ncbi:MAG: class I SAM-dependent DNA methyltransferase [Bryobacteraceae bacterium]